MIRALGLLTPAERKLLKKALKAEPLRVKGGEAWRRDYGFTPTIPVSYTRVKNKRQNLRASKWEDEFSGDSVIVIASTKRGLTDNEPIRRKPYRIARFKF